MSDKITISFDINKSDLDAFTQAVDQKFKSVSNQSKIYQNKNISPDSHDLERHKSKVDGFSQLYLACIRGLLDGGKKDA